jgi:hypothetical protein
MSGTERLKATMDRTNDRDFIEEHSGRILAWEFIHGSFCYRKTLRPCRLAERMGITTEECHEILGGVVGKMKDQLVNTGCGIMKDRK